MPERSRVPASLSRGLLLAATVGCASGCGELLSANDYGLDPGLRVEPCAGMAVPLGDGTCEAVGVLSCGEGFDPDGRGGCVVSFSHQPSCEDGHSIYPGRLSCAPLAAIPCPTNGDPASLPPQIGAASLFVWAGYSGSDSDGSAEHPYRTIGEALAQASEGAVVLVSLGEYREAVVIDRSVELRGICSQGVLVAGDVPGAATITVRRPATLRGMRIEGAGTGIRVEGVDALLSELWIQDTGGVGLEARALFGQKERPKIEIRDSLVDGAGGVGVVVRGVALTMATSQVRDIRPEPDRLAFGSGVEVWPSAYAVARDRAGEALRSVASFERVLIEGVHDAALRVVASQAEVDATLLRDIGASEEAHAMGLPLGGVGLDVTMELGRQLPGEMGAVVMRGSLIERATGAGVRVFRAHARLEDTTIRDTRAAEAPICMGHGVRVVGEGVTPTSVTLLRSLIERSRQTGVHALAASIDVDHSIVRDTAPEACGGSELGDGVGAYAQPQLGDSVAQTRLHRSLVEGSARAPLVVFGGAASVTQSLLADGSPVAAIYSDDDAFDSQRATLELDAAFCPVGSALEACAVSRRALEPALFVRGADGGRVPTVIGIGDVRSGPNGTKVGGAVVWALADDELPAGITDNHGAWSVGHIPAERAQVVVTHAAGNMTRFDQINSPPAGIPIEGAELGVIPLNVLSPEFANLLGAEIDFSRATLNMDTDVGGMAFDVQPDEASALYYLQDQYPTSEEQAGATFDDGEVFVLQQPVARARVSWSQPAGLSSCSPAPYGLIPSYEPNAFSIPLLPGGMNFVRIVCQP